MEDLLDFMQRPAAPKVSAQSAQPFQEKEFTVSELSFEIKRFVETAFGKVRVRGEIFGAKRADSGLERCGRATQH